MSTGIQIERIDQRLLTSSDLERLTKFYRDPDGNLPAFVSRPEA